MATQSFRLTRPIQFQSLTPDAHFHTAHHLGTAYAPTDNGACVRTDWTFPAEHSAEHPADAHATFALLNPFEGTIASTDRAIRADDNATVSNWGREGGIGSAYALLSLPDGAPLADYTLLIGVYDDDHPAGFDVLDPAGNPAGKTFRYHHAITTQGARSDREQSAWLADNSADGVIYTGQPVNITAFLAVDDIGLTLQMDDWQAQPATQVGLNWAQFIVPAGYAGWAELRAGEQVLHRYQVIDIPRTFERPAVDEALDVSFVGVGDLIGVQWTDTPQIIRLIWRGTGSTEVSYTVFAQYLDEQGRVIAQSDSVPAQGNRPTVGWVAGEYIIDTHSFPPVEHGANAQLIIGLYDGRTFERVVTEHGTAFAMVDLP